MRQLVAEGLHRVPGLGQALEIANIPGMLASALGAGDVPNLATGAANALVGGAEALLGAPAALFTGGIDPFFDATTAAGHARARAEGTLIRQNLRSTGRKFSDEATFR